MLRTQPEGYLYISPIERHRVTWDKPEKTPMLGHPSHLVRLQSGAILATYGYRTPPMGIRATLSRDGGKTWDIENETVLRADAKYAVTDVGFPSTVQLAEVALCTLYYITLHDGITHIEGTRWRLLNTRFKCMGRPKASKEKGVMTTSTLE